MISKHDPPSWSSNSCILLRCSFISPFSFARVLWPFHHPRSYRCWYLPSRCSIKFICQLYEHNPAYAFYQRSVWARGGSRGVGDWGDHPPKNYESNFIHHNFVQFGKQHSRYKAILSSIFLSKQCCEAYFIPLTVVKTLWNLATKYYWNRPRNLTGWTRPWFESYRRNSVNLGLLRCSIIGGG